MIRRTGGEVIIATVDAQLMALPLTVPFMTEAAYGQRTGLGRRELQPAQRVEGPAPTVFPQAGSDFYDLSPLAYDFPAVTLTTYRDAVVRGQSNLLTTADAIVRHGLIDMRSEVTPEEFYARLTISEDESEAEWTPTDPFNVDYLPEAATFTDRSAFNYAHWVTEVLPRIAAFAQQPEHAGIPLIVDAELHPNLVRSIAIVAGPEAPLYRLGADHLVRVGVLHNVSPTGYVPFKLREESAEGFSHGLFSPWALGAMTGKLRAGLPAGAGEPARPKLFIRRNATLRHLANEAEIGDVLTARGFVTIQPERLTLEEQIAEYSKAGMIVGATGAAVANLIYCQADCPTVVIMPKFRETAYWYWRRMAAAAGAGPVIHVSGEQVDPLDDPYHPLALHQDFRVEVKDVLDAIEAAEALRR